MSSINRVATAVIINADKETKKRSRRIVMIETIVKVLEEETEFKNLNGIVAKYKS